MSENAKQKVKEIKESFKKLERAAEDLGKNAAPLGDQSLITKIKKVQEASKEVVTHIEERSK